MQRTMTTLGRNFNRKLDPFRAIQAPLFHVELRTRKNVDSVPDVRQTVRRRSSRKGQNILPFVSQRNEKV